jgi:NAD(P)H-flavin reductase
VQEVGQSSRKFVLLKAGDQVAHLVGPLGVPLDIERYGTVALAAGCYGIGAVLGIARAMKAAGNRVLSVVEADSAYLHYYRDELQAASDEFVQTTIDGSNGLKGHSVDVIKRKLEGGEKLDRVFAVGCVFMMMLTGNITKPFGVKTLVALNPIMLDGTGMCGACRVTVGNETKFACVDGPFFDAHEVDWDELWDRRAAYGEDEIHAVARTGAVTPRPGLHVRLS